LRNRGCTLALIVLAALIAPHAARAGACLDLADDTDDLKRLEAFAARKAKQRPVRDSNVDGDRGWLCVELAMANDAIAACTKVLDRDGETGECVLILAAGGVTKVGDHDIFALVSKLPEDPLESPGGLTWTRTALYGTMKDPRGAAAIVEMWKAAIPRADVREHKQGRSMADWSGWRKNAAAILGALGDGEDEAFLLEQAGATKDKYVEKACRDAAETIAKRLPTP
jgi:hypothetical protein